MLEAQRADYGGLKADNLHSSYGVWGSSVSSLWGSSVSSPSGVWGEADFYSSAFLASQKASGENNF